MAIGITAVFALAAAVAGSQGSPASMQGVVRDPQGAVIPGAAVTVSCGDTVVNTTADARGEFQQMGLPTGRCSVTAKSDLFEARTMSVILTAAGANAVLVLQVRGFTSEMVVTPTGVREDTFGVPQMVSVTSRADIDSRPSQLLPQVLREEPGVLLQQTTSAQTSPIIRGFTGQSNVYLLDGVRFNTAAWRSGPSQYTAWFDASLVDRLEVARGPGSVQYGSDALGGTINFLSASPAFSPAGTSVHGQVEALVGSADRSSDGQAEVQIQSRSAAIRVGGVKRQVQNLRAGDAGDSHSALTRFLGLPPSTLYSRLPETAFDQSGGFLVARARLGDRATLNGLYVHETQTGVGRYDRTLGGDGLHRSGFTPQTLDFALLKYERSHLAGFDGISATLSINRQGDGRFEQTRPTTRLDSQEATSRVHGYQVQGTRTIARRHSVILGGEVYDESISAARRLADPSTGAIENARPDIADGTTYNTVGLFVQDSTELVPGRLSVRGGLRYGRFSFASIASPTLGVTTDQITTDDVTFNAATVVSVTRRLNATFSVSRGFRAANAADLGSIGLTGGSGFEITPSKASELGGLVGTTTAATAVSTGERVPALGSEVLYAYEAGLKYRSDRFDASIMGYDLEFLDSIQRRAIAFDANVVGTSISGFQIVRQDVNGLAYIAQDVRPIATRVNVDRARVLGFEAEGTARIAANWTAVAFFSLSDGHLVTTGEYMRRMPPPLGGARLRWTGQRAWAEGVVSFARTQTRLASGDLSDARIGGLRTRATIATFFNGTATDLGLVRNSRLVATGETLAEVQNRVLGTAASAPLFTSEPGFVVLGVRAGWRVLSQVELTVIGENMTDQNYRLYGSGLDASGVNVQARIRYRF